jgi:tRNA (guanine37-N1)-methyltransferase
MTTLRQAISKKLNQEEKDALIASYDVIGTIAIIEIPEILEKKEKMIGETILKLHPNIKTVAKKIGIHKGFYRTQKLKIISGKRSKTTLYKENNIRLKLHVEKVYFSPRSSSERKRIMQLVKPNEKVLIMFAGCGPYTCCIAKNSSAEKIVAIEINPAAHSFAVENVQLNKIKKATCLNGDVNDVIPKLEEKFDRILMPLPKTGEHFLELALIASKKGTTIHYYTFANEKEISDESKILKNLFEKNRVKYKIEKVVKCGQYSPRVYRICFDLKIVSKPSTSPDSSS